MAVAVLVTIAVLAWPGRGDPERAMIVAAQALAAPAACIALGVGVIAGARFRDPRLIDGETATGVVALADRYLRNSVEQGVLAAGAWLAFAAADPARAAVLVPRLAVLYVIARLAFAIGYAIAPPARAFGFALTFYPSVGVLALAVLAMVRGQR